MSQEEEKIKSAKVALFTMIFSYSSLFQRNRKPAISGLRRVRRLCPPANGGFLPREARSGMLLQVNSNNYSIA
jgi:hypothetical protein